jgi:hypothetical protein
MLKKKKMKIFPLTLCSRFYSHEGRERKEDPDFTFQIGRLPMDENPYRIFIFYLSCFPSLPLPSPPKINVPEQVKSKWEGEKKGIKGW